MSQILGIPVPSPEQIIVGTELIFILYVPKRLASTIGNRLDSELRKERNRIIKHHVKSGHDSRFFTCIAGDCASLQSSAQLDSQPELELEL